jgi:hypothetical protein
MSITEYTSKPIRALFDRLVQGIKVSWEIEEDALHHCGQGEINVTLFILEHGRTSSISHTNKHFGEL